MNRAESATHTFRITYGSKASLVSEGIADADKTRSIYTNTFSVMYGSTPYKLITSRVKKGSGKGKLRMQKVIVKSENSSSPLTGLIEN